MNWFHLSLISIFALALADLSQQFLLTKAKHFTEQTSSTATFFTQMLFTIPLILIFRSPKELLIIFEPSVIGRALLVSFISSVAVIFYFRSFMVKSISISNIMVSFSVVVSASLGVLLFKESISFIKILGIFLILGAILSVNIKNARIEKNHLYGLLAGFLLGISYTIDKSILIDFDPVIYIFWTFLFVSIFSFLIAPKKVIKTIRTASINEFMPIIISSIGYWMYNFATFRAYNIGGEVGKIDAINNSSVFLVILFEYYVLKEKKGYWRNVITAIVAFIGVYILGTYP